MVKKPALIILHGALGCKEQFTEWARKLSKKFDCLLMDFSGHGSRSGEEIDFSIELFSEDLKKFIQIHRLTRPHILGYSMGGYVALYSARENPELLGKIITIATKFDWNPETSKKEAGYLKPELMLQKVPALAEQLKQRHGEHCVERDRHDVARCGARPSTGHAPAREVPYALVELDARGVAEVEAVPDPLEARFDQLHLFGDRADDAGDLAALGHVRELRLGDDAGRHALEDLLLQPGLERQRSCSSNDEGPFRRVV